MTNVKKNVSINANHSTLINEGIQLILHDFVLVVQPLHGIFSLSEIMLNFIHLRN